MLAMFPDPSAARGPGGDVYGMDSWPDAATTLEYAFVPENTTNPVRRIREKEKQEEELEANKIWNVKLTEIEPYELESGKACWEDHEEENL